MCHSRIFHPSHPWIVDILFLLGQLYASFGSNCLAIEIIFTHLSIDISDFSRGIEIQAVFKVPLYPQTV